MIPLKSTVLVSGTEALSSLTHVIVKYTGGDSGLGRRVRLSAAVVLLSLALRIVTSGRPKRNAIQRDPRKVGKVVGGAVNSHQDNFNEYDVIIVGGGIAERQLKEPGFDRFPFTGTAGCVLASRLSEDPKLRVLLLEAGERCI
jgi:hypothetical protein